MVTSSHAEIGTGMGSTSSLLRGKKPGESQQHAEDSAGGAEHRLYDLGLMKHHEFCCRARQYAREVERHVEKWCAVLAPIQLQRTAEHVESEHVEDNVHQVIRVVEERVTDNLPRMEQGAERPKCEQHDESLRHELLEHVHDDVRDENDPGNRLQRRECEHAGSLPARSMRREILRSRRLQRITQESYERGRRAVRNIEA